MRIKSEQARREFDRLASDMAARNFAPVYILYGEERRLMREASEKIVDAALTEAGKGFDLEILSGGELAAKDLLDKLSSTPMAGAKRVVVVRDADSLKKKEREKLSPYFRAPARDSILIMSGRTNVLEQKNPKAVSENIKVLHFPMLDAASVTTWMQAQVEASGKRISSSSCEMVQEYVGASLEDVGSELDKLLLYVGNRGTIQPEDIQTVVGNTRDVTVFDLQWAIARRDARSAQSLMVRLIEGGIEAPFVVVMLTKFFQKAWIASDPRLKGKDIADVLAGVGGTSWMRREWYEASKRFNRSQIERALRLLLAADIATKSTSIPKEVTLSVLLSGILDASESAAGNLPF